MQLIKFGILFNNLGDNGPAVNAKFNFPSGLAFDSKYNLYISDTNNHLVRKINMTTGIVTRGNVLLCPSIINII